MSATSSNSSGSGSSSSSGSGSGKDLIRIEMVACRQWWLRHNRDFSLWFLSLPSKSQQQLLLSKCPSMRRRVADGAAGSSCIGGEAADAAPPQLTDYVLSELVCEDLLGCQGKILILLFARRLAGKVSCQVEDLQLIKNLRNKGTLPSVEQLSRYYGNSELFQTVFKPLVGLDTPFIDLHDMDEKVQCLDASQIMLKEIDSTSPPPPPSTSSSSSQAHIAANSGPSIRQQLEAHLISGRVVHADVWIWAKLRTSVLNSFLVGLMEEFQQQAVVKPSPTIQALIRGETQQEDAFL